MCKELETKIYQQSLLLRRFHSELTSMVDEYNRMCEESDSTQSTLNQPTSSQADWEEVIEMAKLPVEDVISRPCLMGGHHSGSSHNGGSGSNCDSFFRTIYQSPLSDTTATGSADQAVGTKSTVAGASPTAPPPTAVGSNGSGTDGRAYNVPLRRSPQKTFPCQMTPPMEEVAELRQRLRELEQSPLFTSSQLIKRSHSDGISPSMLVPSHSSSRVKLPQHQQKEQLKQSNHLLQLRCPQTQPPNRPLYSLP
ncbi:hypothetical protein LPJ72_004836 [Coemansia sp. Benny D160-2]|nr:hypothetical protein LPJ72_004836 [Coemansia sp. Benny D160-2]